MSEDLKEIISQIGFGTMMDTQYSTVVDALFFIGRQLKTLGTGDADTDMGAIEFLAKEINGGLLSVAVSLDGIAEALREGN